MAEELGIIGASPSQRERLRFCDRITELAVFEKALADSSRNLQILAVSGIGGVGKSTLLRAFRRIALDKNALVGLTSGDTAATRSTILRDLSFQIGNDVEAKSRLKKFFRDADRLTKIERHLSETAKPTIGENAVSDMATEAIKGGVGSAVGAVIGLAVAGPPGAVAGGVISGALAPLVESASRNLLSTFAAKGISKQDAEFFQRADEHLIHDFLAGINGLARDNRKLVLLFDAVEYLGTVLEWVRDGLLKQLWPHNVVVVLAGRYRVAASSEWSEWLPNLSRIELQPFDKPTADDYLRKSGVIDPRLQDYVYDQTDGLPIGIALWALYAPELAANDSSYADKLAIDAMGVTDRVVENIMRNLPDRKLRNVLWLASVPRWFNAELLALLLESDDASTEYDRLAALEPLIKRALRGLSLHDGIRDRLRQSLSQRNPEKYRQLHELCLQYFADRKSDVERIGRVYDPEWQDYVLEWIYHSLILGNRAVLEIEVDRASRFYQHDFTERLVADVEKYIPHVQEVRRVHAYLKGCDLVHHNDFLSAITVFRSILTEDRVASRDEFNYLIYYRIGWAYFWLGDHESAVQYLHKAAEGFDAQGNVRMLSRAYIDLSKVKECIGDIADSICWRKRALRYLRILARAAEKDDDRVYANRMYSVAEVLRLRGSYLRATTIHCACLKLREQLGNQFDVGESHISLGECLLKLGRHAESEAHLRVATTIFELTDDQYMLSDIHRLLGKLMLLGGRIEDAKAELRLAVALGNQSQNRRSVMEADRLLRENSI